MVSPDFDDPYLNPGSDVLQNLVGATSTSELSSAEADLSFARALQLLETPAPATNDLRGLRAIHSHLFQDVYDWAGELRTVDVRKNVPGAEFFLPYGFIVNAAAICFRELAEEQFLAKLDRKTFIERLAYHYEKINYIHPFREGNGPYTTHLLEPHRTASRTATGLAPRPRRRKPHRSSRRIRRARPRSADSNVRQDRDRASRARDRSMDDPGDSTTVDHTI